MTELSGSLPKYAALKEYLKNEILEGRIKYGDKIPSENELADNFNLSRHTVRQALSLLVNGGWVYKEQGKGTFCSYTKDKGINSKGKTIAVLTTYISDYIFTNIISGIEEVLSLRGYNMLLANTDNDKEKEAQHINNLIEQNISGMIIEPTKSAAKNVNIDELNKIKGKDIKLVYINSCYDEPEGSYIIMNDEKGGYISTKYLIDIGHKNIAGIFKCDDVQGIKRQKGFLKALNDYNLEFSKDYLCQYQTSEKNNEPCNFVKRIIKNENRPTAIVCYNDEIALKVINAINEEGLKVPEDISIVGYDDSTLAVASQIKLTTIRHPQRVMGKQAAQFLIDMIEGKTKMPFMVYEPELVVRNSCRSMYNTSVK